MTKKLKKYTTELVYSVDNHDGSLSDGAKKHLRRVLRGHLAKLEVPYHEGRVRMSGRDYYCFYSSSDYEDVITGLLRMFGEEYYCRITTTNAVNIREVEKMQIVGKKEVLKDILQLTKVKTASDNFFFDGRTKSCWLVVGRVEDNQDIA